MDITLNHAHSQRWQLCVPWSNLPRSRRAYNPRGNRGADATQSPLFRSWMYRLGFKKILEGWKITRRINTSAPFLVILADCSSNGVIQGQPSLLRFSDTLCEATLKHLRQTSDKAISVIYCLDLIHISLT